MPTYPLTPPAELRFSVIDVGRVSVTGMNVSPYSMAQEVYQWPGQGWTLAVTVPPNTDRAVQRALDAFVAALDGRFGTFSMALPDHTPNPAILVNPTLAVAAAARAASLSVQHGAGAPFVVGDVFALAGRIHMVTIAGAKVGGVQVVEIWPRLRAAAAVAAVINATAPVGLWRLADDRQGYQLDLVSRSNSLKIVEAQ